MPFIAITLVYLSFNNNAVKPTVLIIHVVAISENIDQTVCNKFNSACKPFIQFYGRTQYLL